MFTYTYFRMYLYPFLYTPFYDLDRLKDTFLYTPFYELDRLKDNNLLNRMTASYTDKLGILPEEAGDMSPSCRTFCYYTDQSEIKSYFNYF